MHTLYVVATPIGNLEDISVRAIRVLLGTKIIACEDTRRTGNLIKLLQDRYGQFSNFKFQISNLRRFISVRDWNEAQVVDSLVRYLATGDVALVSDAGTPLVSDPGFKVVRAARQAGFTVSPIPGPNAAIAALSASGLPTDKFVFWGFLPKKWELFPNVTNIIYESPHRVQKTMAEIQSRYPEAEIVVASELTKVHEQVQRIESYSFYSFATEEDSILSGLSGVDSPKGEWVILVNYGQP